MFLKLTLWGYGLQSPLNVVLVKLDILIIIERLVYNIGLAWSPVPCKAVWKSLIKLKFD